MNEIDRQEVSQFRSIDVLNTLNSVTYAFSSRPFGNMAFPYGDMVEVIASRKRFLAAIDMDLDGVVFMRPVHKVNVEVVGNGDKGKGAWESSSAISSTDALITTDKQVGLALNAADCAPIIMTNKKAEFIALYHAGREGTDLQIGRVVISRLRKMGFTNLDDFVVGIGPVIGSCCYKQQYLQTHTPEPWIPYLSFENNSGYTIERINNLEPPLYKVRSDDNRSRLSLDLGGFNRAQLIMAGIPESNIGQSVLTCTACEAEKGAIFSHVISSRYIGTPQAVDFPEGRFMAVVCLK